VVPLAVTNLLEAADGVFDRRDFARLAGEDLCHDERLRQEPLNAAGPVYDELVVFAQFIDAENGDDVLQLAVPLGLVSMLASVNSNIPRYFLEAYKGHTALGIFSPIASLLTAGALIVSSMGQAAFVPVAQAYEAADIDRYRRFVVRALALACGLGIVGIVASAVVGREILALLFGTAYGDQSRLLVWLACAGAISFAVSGLGYIMTAARFLNPQVPLLAASCVAAVGGSIWLIPRYGLDGAAWVVGLSALVQLAGTFLILFRIDRKLRMEQRLRDEVALNIDHEVQLSLARSAEGGVR